MGELEGELVGDEITRQDVEKYKEDIKEYLMKLIQETLMGVKFEGFHASYPPLVANPTA